MIDGTVRQDHLTAGDPRARHSLRDEQDARLMSDVFRTPGGLDAVVLTISLDGPPTDGMALLRGDYERSMARNQTPNGVRRAAERMREIAEEAPTDDLEEALYRVISRRQDLHGHPGFPAYDKRQSAKAVADYLGNNRCLSKLDPGEPIFVVKGRDLLARKVVELWTNLFAIVMGEDHPKAVDGRRLVARFKAWKSARFPT